MYFTKQGKPKGIPISKAFGFGETFYKNLLKKEDTPKINLLNLGASLLGANAKYVLESNIIILDVSFGNGKAFISYAKNGIKCIEECFFDTCTNEFYITPIHIEHENRFDDFRTSTALSMIKKLHRFKEKGSILLNH